MEVEKKLEELGFVLPDAETPIANYIVARRTGNLVYTAGQVGNAAKDGFGKLGSEVTIKEGYRRAQHAALDNLACIKSIIGDLDKITQFVKLLCMVNSAPGFTDQPVVADGASDLIIEVFGERGRHARSAVGMAELPTNACIEIEMIVEVED